MLHFDRKSLKCSRAIRYMHPSGPPVTHGTLWFVKIQAADSNREYSTVPALAKSPAVCCLVAVVSRVDIVFNIAARRVVRKPVSIQHWGASSNFGAIHRIQQISYLQTHLTTALNSVAKNESP